MVCRIVHSNLFHVTPRSEGKVELPAGLKIGAGQAQAVGPVNLCEGKLGM